MNNERMDTGCTCLIINCQGNQLFYSRTIIQVSKFLIFSIISNIGEFKNDQLWNIGPQKVSYPWDLKIYRKSNHRPPNWTS